MQVSYIFYAVIFSKESNNKYVLFYCPRILCPDKYIIHFRILFICSEYHLETFLFNSF